jgi:hypothetical protein
MLNPVNSADQVIAARLVELLDPSTPWNRSLWSINTLLTLREILEAVEASRSGVLGSDSLKRLSSLAIRLAGKDPGVLAAERQVLGEVLQNPPRHDGLAYHTVAQLLDRIAPDYLIRWAAALNETPQPQAERTARSIAGYLLDRGFSEEFLHGWFTKWLYQKETRLTLGELLQQAQTDLIQRPLLDFEVLIAFKNAPRSASGFPKGWLNSKQLSHWLRANKFDVTDVRASGGISLKIQARDANAAVQLASDKIDRFTARASVSTSVPLQPWPNIWVRGERAIFPFGPRPRGVKVKALYREDQLFSESNSSVDAAIELLAHLEGSSPTAAIAGGWAAIEALLAEPNDRAGAADSLASIVACSFPRAELTALSYTAEKTCPDLQSKLSECRENRERAIVIAQSIIDGHTLNLRRHSDKAAYFRMEKLLRAPSKVLSDIQAHVADAFHRLYRQRNLILHGGKTNSVVLEGSLRTSAKLAGAGMDRITHAWYVKGIGPIELAARSKSAIPLVPQDNPLACVNLLGM